MTTLAPLAAAVALLCALRWLRRPASGGRLGEAIRNSDHWAWEMAIEEKERELNELRQAEPRP